MSHIHTDEDLKALKDRIIKILNDMEIPFWCIQPWGVTREKGAPRFCICSYGASMIVGTDRLTQIPCSIRNWYKKNKEKIEIYLKEEGNETQSKD